MPESNAAADKQPERSSLDIYFDVMSESVPSVGNLRFYLTYLFKGIEFRGKRVLDVGAASGGRYSFYAACQDAAEVVALQAHDAGSTTGEAKDFARATQRLGLANVRLVSGRVPDLGPLQEHFDVLLLYASINHLDEDACIRLREDQAARNVYLELLGELRRLAAPRARLLVVDCSSRNLFARFGTNPLSPAIEWEKHHAPELWIDLLGQVGFENPFIRWNSFNTLRSPGRFFLGNRFAAYCTTSVFCLTMDRSL